MIFLVLLLCACLYFLCVANAQCNKFADALWLSTTGKWATSGHRLQWTADGCLGELCASPKHFQQFALQVLKGKRVALLGDSQIFMTAHYLMDLLSGCRQTDGVPPSSCYLKKCVTLRRGRRCNNGRAFYHFAQPATKAARGYIPVNRKEWPARCSDCRTCKPEEVLCGRRSVHLEVHTVEYSRDGEVQSKWYNTTQENVILKHLARQPESIPDLLLFNAGLHDAGRVAAKDYAHNMAYYADMLVQLRLQKPSIKLIYVLTTGVHAVPFERRGMTNNRNIDALNRAAQAIMMERNISLINGYSLGPGSHALYLHGDPVHKRVPYYQMLWCALLTVLNNTADVLPSTNSTRE